MAKYSTILLDVDKLNNGFYNAQNLGLSKNNSLTEGLAIYVYRSSKTNKVYVGQTKHFYQRNKEHYSGKEEKFNEANFDEVIVMISQLFNGTALDDVERQLITYFLADSETSKKSKSVKNVFYDENEIINGTNGNSVISYSNQEEVASEVIVPFWEKELGQKLKWVNTPTLDELRAAELFKYSPLKNLTGQQEEIISQVISNPLKNFVIKGDAGTGKTVLLTHLVAKAAREFPNKKIAVVVKSNWEEIAKKIFKVYGLNKDNLKIGTSIKIIKEFSETSEKFDMVIVDESHTLSRRGNKQHPTFNKVYELKGNEEAESHLELLKKSTNQLILMYDALQTVRPAQISREMFKELTADFEEVNLKTQFRIAVEDDKYTSDDYINGIKYLLYKDTGLLKYTNFDPNFNKGIFSQKGFDAYFGIVEDKPLHALKDWIEEDRNYNPAHVNRILAGLVEPWKQSDGKNEEIKHWFEDDLALRWNSTQESWLNSKDEDREDQIGSIFSVQGIDLNKVGVLIGNDLQVDENGKLYAERDNLKNINTVYTKDEADDPLIQEEFTLRVLNAYYVLLTRGIDGIRVGFWKNEKFKKYMKETLEID